MGTQEDMDDERVPSPHMMLAMASECPATAHGWLWYCEVHDIHGTANSQDEADHLARAHREFHDEGEFQYRCAVSVWLRTRHERIAEV